MSATEAKRPSKPPRKYAKKPYTPGQSVASTKLPPEELDLLRDVARMTDRTVSDLVRRAIDAQMPQLMNDIVERAVVLSREEDVDGNNDETRKERDGP